MGNTDSSAPSLHTNNDHAVKSKMHRMRSRSTVKQRASAVLAKMHSSHNLSPRTHPLSPFGQYRRPRLFSSASAPTPIVTCSVPSFSMDEFKQPDLKESLPENLKVYQHSIQMIYSFWCSEIETLPPDDYKEATVLFYVNVFKLIPAVRPLFTSKNIESQARQFFGMFRWLITNLSQPHPERLLSRIKLLGAMHQKMNIKPEWFKLFLQAFHETMSETMNDSYTVRIRFCFEQLYTVVMNIMLDLDFESLSSLKIARLLKSLGKLEDCLDDEEASAYLELYMRQQFCVELILFYQHCRRFKVSLSKAHRQESGKEIMKKYLNEFSECEINVSYGARSRVNDRLNTNNKMFEGDTFDECMKECLELIRNNTWDGFKESITRMAVDADTHYEENKSRSPQPYLQTPLPSPFASYPSPQMAASPNSMSTTLSF